MAAKFVTITREQLEDWLFDLCPVFERVEDTSGVFLVPVSSAVAVKVSTTLTRAGKNTSRGEGRCWMVFVARHGGRAIRLSDAVKDARGCNRTQGWAENWAENLRAMFDLFKEHRDRYTELALMKQPEYAKQWVAKIEGVKGHEDFNILVDIRRKLREGAWLTPRQEAAVMKFVNPPKKGAKKKSTTSGPRRRAKKTTAKTKTKKPMTDEQKRLLAAVRQLAAAAEKKDDGWLVDFCDSLETRLKRGSDLTKRQREVLDKNLKKFKVAIPAAA